MKKLTAQEFIEKATNIYGNKYDYSKTNYRNNSTKIIIICKKHREFLQKPSSHLSGHECIKCSYESRGLTRKVGLEKEKLIKSAGYNLITKWGI